MAYPKLKSDQKFQHLPARITGLENVIADCCEFYNESVNVNNLRNQQVPDVFIASVFDFQGHKLPILTDEETTDVKS